MNLCSHCDAKILPGRVACSVCDAPVEEDDQDDPLLGTTIAGSYEVLELIGEGAMGRVYRAHQPSLAKDIAIKVLHPHLTSDPKVKRRFHREARAASRLSHPHSVQMIDFGSDDGRLYIAMELLEGPDLLEVIEEESPLAPARIALLLGQVLLALDEAHHSGIIHRDLKPENVVVTETRESEHVKVCDFGIAKIIEAEGSAITVTGFVCGTPEYIAPEQARGDALDQRVDIYAVGCVLFQMLTGTVPFSANSALGTITKHLTEEVVPPRERRPDLEIPPRLEHVCLRAMSKDREDRYDSAAEMRDALIEAVDALGEAATHALPESDRAAPIRETVNPRAETEAAVVAIATPKPNRTWPLAAALIAIASLGAVWFITRSADAPVERSDPEERAPEIAAPPVQAPVAPEMVPAPHPVTPPPDVVEPAVQEPETTAMTPPLEQTRRAPRRARPRSTMSSMTSTMSHPTDATVAMTMTSAPRQSAFDEGRALFRAGDVRAAIPKLEAATRAQPRNAQAFRYLGRAHMRVRQIEQGRRAYRRYLELSPSAPDRAVIEQIIE